MSIVRNLGGDRLGSGNKNNIALHNYERSTHNLSRTWRSSMACGTLVPFLTEIGLPGDTFDIDLKAMVRTIPTIGPLMGSFKLQLDIFQAPMRLYNGCLHNNALNVGMEMQNIKIPKVEIETLAGKHVDSGKEISVRQINPSSLMSYLGVNGVGYYAGETSMPVRRKFNALPLLAYWDIYKNYYANKQEDNAYLITGEQEQLIGGNIEAVFAACVTPDAKGGYTPRFDWMNPHPGVDQQGNFMLPAIEQQAVPCDFQHGMRIANNVIIGKNGERFPMGYYIFGTGLKAENIMLNGADWLGDYGWIHEFDYNGYTFVLFVPFENLEPMDQCTLESRVSDYRVNKLKIQSFPLTNIDEMREELLRTRKGEEFVLNHNTPLLEPYLTSWRLTDDGRTYNIFDMNGLGLKTYQSDLFNNWVKDDFINMANGVSAVRVAIDQATGEGSFNIEDLALSRKMWEMMNRVAVSGGSYQDWTEVQWGVNAMRMAETPIFHGGLSSEIVFEEVINTSNAGGDLGKIGGKGTLSQQKNGGKVVIHVNEPSIIMGIVSITPRIDYSQGNKWFMTNLDTFNDLHKPALDGIGFEDLMTEQMAWFDREFDARGNLKPGRSAGKVPAWIEYMTAYDEVKGDFAIAEKAGWLVLNRKYRLDENTNSIEDLTTYIDPTKYNECFADTTLSAQNFWVQIGVGIEARRKMSAKIIPNL